MPELSNMFQNLPSTAQDVVDQLDIVYESRIRTGEFIPFTYPFGTIGAAVVLLYLLIDHRSSPFLRGLRYPVWIFNLLFSGYCILFTRARNPATAFGVGLISAWSILWTSVLLVFNDAQTDFRRIERREKAGREERPSDGSTGQATGTDAGSAVDGAASSDGMSFRTKPQSSSNGAVGATQGPAQRQGSFAWQSYPVRPFLERIDWVADIFCNFRGMGWNWRIPGLPPPPTSVQEDLSQNDHGPALPEIPHDSRIAMRAEHDRSALLRRSATVFARNYLILDLLKTLIAHDPYFWGIIGIADLPAPGYLPISLRQSLVAIKSARLLISLAAISYALEFIFSLGPLVFVGLLGPARIGARGEAWMYPDQFGAFSNVLDKGLAGWWGGWWHQTFRFAFQEPARRAVDALGWDSRAPKAKLLQVSIAFVLSGILHMCGSYTQVGETWPVRGPFCFFVSQMLGLTLQMAAAGALKRVGVRQNAPRWVRRAANFAFAHVWLYFTAPLLVDDFARGGVWLFEPIPVSIFRGLGFGSSNDGVWQWTGQLARWHSGRHWWESGIAL